MSYVKNYNVGQTKLDLPYANYIHELPLLSFGDVQHTINLSLVFNQQRKAAGDNSFNIASGFKLNMQKKLRISGDSISYQEESGKLVNLTAFGDVYTFNDDSQRILRRTEQIIAPPIGGGGSITPDLTVTLYDYTVEYPDYSKEEYNSSGYISGVYDKYGTKFLSYTYDGSKLTAITYRGTKTISLTYNDSNKLSLITYAGHDIGVEVNGDTVKIEHFSGVDYHLNSSGNNLIVHSADKDESYSNEFSHRTTCEQTFNEITITKEVGGTLNEPNVVDTTTATFPSDIEAPTDSFSFVDITDHYGVKTRIHYNYLDKPMYSYEIEGSDVKFGVNNDYYNNRHLGNVNIYGTEDDIEGSHNATIQSPNYSHCMQHSTLSGATHWKMFDLPTADTKGYFVLTGWLNFATNVSQCDFNLANSTLSFSIPCVKAGQWQFFAYKFAHKNASVDVYTSYGTNAVETRDFRLQYVTTHVQTEDSKSHIAISEDVLKSGSTCIPIKDCVFYCNGSNISNRGTVHFEDILKYKINQNKNLHTTEFYCDRAKTVINNVSTVTFTHNGNTYNLDNCNIGKQNFTAQGIINTNYRTDNPFFLSIFIEDESYNTLKSISYNEFLDVDTENNDGIVTQYFREDNGLVYKQETAPYHGIGETVDENLVFVRKFNYNDSGTNANTKFTKLESVVDEFDNTIEYTTDDTWGVVIGITVKDSTGVVQSIITDNYDDDKCALVSREFSNATNARNTAFTYSGGNLTGLTDGTISYDFAYSNGDLTSVSRDGTAIETHTVSGDRKVYTSTYGSHSIVGRYDNYGRLTKVDDVVENAYDVMPTFDEDSGDLITKSANGSAVLATSKDLTNNQLSKYHYNNGRLESIETKNSSGTVVSEGMFTYDDIGRLSKDTFTYDNLNGKYVESDIGYQKAVTDPMADGRISTYSYKVQGAQKANTANTFDVFNRVSGKEYTIDGMKFTKNITYTKTRPTKIEDNFAFNNLATTTYGYDAMGRISSVNNGKPITYEYDEYGQLVRENNKILDKTFQYEYNGIGNIESVKTYAYTPQGTALNTTPTVQSFTYDDETNSNTTHPDRLISFGSKAITYNSRGCPTSYDGKNFTWSKGKLATFGTAPSLSFDDPFSRYRYSYNAKGQRTLKAYSYTPGAQTLVDYLTDKNIVYTYDNAGRLIYEKRSENYKKEYSITREFTYLYDESGMIGFMYSYEGATPQAYYYQRNLQGDVVAIRNKKGQKQAEYAYDAYGNCTIIDSTNSDIATANAIRYRGYYYDDETGWYYLNARYYSPEWRRFISPDDTTYLDPESVNGLNLYCYCGNDPINFVDPSGHMPNWIKWLIGGVAFAGAVVLTTVSGGALAPVFIGMGASILTGGLIEGAISALNGESFWDGFSNGAANGAMWGGIFALMSSTINLIKYWDLIHSRGVVIGKGMGRVEFFADQAALSKYSPMKGYNFIKGSGNVKWRMKIADTLSIAHNKSWINRVMRLNKPIYDIGLGGIVEAGAWYGMELKQVANYAFRIFY